LYRDYETRSTAVLKHVGAHKYAADPTTDVLCCAFVVDDEQVQLWVPGDPVPPEFVEAATNANWIVVAHADHFESAIERHIMGLRFGWPEIPVERHYCTMAMAAVVGMPTRLSAAADALELAARKDVAGERLMHQMSKPRRARQDEDPNQIHWFDDDERLQRLYEYCRQDVAVERGLFERLPPLSKAEHVLWQLSCRINDRGFHVDREFAEAARRIAQAAVPEIDAELGELTGGAVTSINQVARLLVWLQQQSCTIEKLTGSAVHFATTAPPPGAGPARDYSRRT
jgi:DNA polymerase